jgi:YD repeat-containing protein
MGREGNENADVSEKETPKDTSNPRTLSMYSEAYGAIKLNEPAAATGDKFTSADKTTGTMEVPPDPTLAKDAAPPQHVEKNKDGSTVAFEKGPDGKEHPSKITYTDGRSTEYSYDKDGKVIGFRNINADGSVKEDYRSLDGKHFGDAISGKPMEGTLSVNKDGTAKVTFDNGATMESHTDGRAVMTFKDAKGDAHKMLLNADGSSVEYKKGPDGKEHPGVVRRPTGEETTYEYNKDGKLSAVTEQLGGKILSRFTSENGKDWKNAYGPGEIHGELSVSENGEHKFKDADSGNTVTHYSDGHWTAVDKDGHEIKPQPAEQQQQGARPVPRAKK